MPWPIGYPGQVARHGSRAAIDDESTVNDVFSPNKFASTAAAELLMTEWADGYSGCAGVTIRGVQPASTAVPGFPSVSARAIAWWGWVMRLVQSGQAQHYALGMTLGAVLILSVYLFL